VNALYAVARFWSKVDVRRRGMCWEWRAGTGSHGYGVFYPEPGVQELAHRYALTQSAGPAPAGAEALHGCDNKLCVNPAHLRWGTHAENMADAAERGLSFAPNASRTHCPHDHELTPENTLRKTKRGQNGKTYQARACRECNRIYLAKRRERRAA